MNVSPNVNFTQSILPCLAQDEATIDLSLKIQIEQKSPNLIGNVHPNLIMTTLHDFLNTPFYGEVDQKITLQINGKWPSNRPWYIES